MKFTRKISCGAALLLLAEVLFTLPLAGGASVLSGVRRLWLSGGLLRIPAAFFAALPSVLALGLLICLLAAERRAGAAASERLSEASSAPPAATGNPADVPSREPAPGAVPACIRLLTGMQSGERVPIPDDADILLGRSKQECQIVLGESDISRVHLCIRYISARKTFLLTDRSTNGTYWQDGRRLPANLSLEVPDGSIFYLGRRSVLLQLLSNGEESI